MRYCPASSETPVRTLVMSAGLDASIVTPGSTAPDVSRTVPARLCAVAKVGAAPTMAITANNRISIRFMSDTLHNRSRHEAERSSRRRERADYGPFDYESQGRRAAPLLPARLVAIALRPVLEQRDHGAAGVGHE